ncbi:MAG: SCO family protein [Rhodovibrionaceae bacterium]
MLPKSLPGRIGLGVTVFLLLAAAALFAWSRFDQGGKEAIGQAAIGGPFELVDQNGVPRSEQDFRGRYMLVYFGYTYCPDICPTTLATMSRGLEALAERAPEKAEAVVPIFITVDPQRDDVEAMTGYVPHFHDRLVGLTGTQEQVAAAAKEYRIYYSKVEEEGGDPEGYLMDHSSFIYLIGPEGSYVTHFGHDATVEDIAAGLEERVQPQG